MVLVLVVLVVWVLVLVWVVNRVSPARENPNVCLARRKVGSFAEGERGCGRIRVTPSVIAFFSWSKTMGHHSCRSTGTSMFSIRHFAVLVAISSLARAEDSFYVRVNNFTADTDKYFDHLKTLRRRLPVKEFPFKLSKEDLVPPSHLYPDPEGFRHFSGIAMQVSNGKLRKFGFRSVESEKIFRQYLEIKAALRGNGTKVVEHDGVTTLTTPPPPPSVDGSPVIRTIDQKYGFQHPFVLVNVPQDWRPDTRSLMDVCRQSEGSDYLYYFAPSKVPKALRRSYLAQISAIAGTGMQRRDHETLTAWLTRRLIFGLGSEMAEKLVFEVDQITIKQRFLGPKTDPRIIVRIDPTPGSRLAALVRSLNSGRGALTHPVEGILSLSANCNIPPRLADYFDTQKADLDSGSLFQRIAKDVLRQPQLEFLAAIETDAESRIRGDFEMRARDISASASTVAEAINGGLNVFNIAQAKWWAPAFGEELAGEYALEVGNNVLRGAMQMDDRPIQFTKDTDKSVAKRYPPGTIFAATFQLNSLVEMSPDHPVKSLLSTIERMYHQREIENLPAMFLQFNDSGEPKFRSILEEETSAQPCTGEVTVRVEGASLVFHAECSTELLCLAYGRKVFTNRAIYGRRGFNN